MSLRLVASFLLLVAVALPQRSAIALEPVPYQLELTETPVDGLPGLHSFAHAHYKGWIIVLGGRTNGLHGFASGASARTAPAFAKNRFNDTVYLIAPEAGRVYGKSTVDGLPKRIAHQLASTNTQCSVRDGWLYVVGGYGLTEDGESLATGSQVTAINLDGLIRQLLDGKPLDLDFAKRCMRVGSHPALAVTGGAMEQLNGLFLLVFGHRYDGEYTPGGGLARQEYSESVRGFDFEPGDGVGSDGVPQLTVVFKAMTPNPGFNFSIREVQREGKVPPGVTFALGQDPDGPYHRRDLPVHTAFDRDGNVVLSAYGGVFKGGRMEGYVNPIQVTVDNSGKLPEIKLHEDTETVQLLSQYECPVIAAHSHRTGVMYSTFFGGISQYYWNEESQSLRRDTVNMVRRPPRDGLPFINSISTLRVDVDSANQYLHVGKTFPPKPLKCGDHDAPMLGAETVFVLAQDVPAEHGVIQLDDLKGPSRIGWLLGGIASTGPYGPNGTCASSAVYQVRLLPCKPTKTAKLKLPEGN